MLKILKDLINIPDVSLLLKENHLYNKVTIIEVNKEFVIFKKYLTQSENYFVYEEEYDEEEEKKNQNVLSKTSCSNNLNNFCLKEEKEENNFKTVFDKLDLFVYSCKTQDIISVAYQYNNYQIEKTRQTLNKNFKKNRPIFKRLFKLE